MATRRDITTGGIESDRFRSGSRRARRSGLRDARARACKRRKIAKFARPDEDLFHETTFYSDSSFVLTLHLVDVYIKYSFYTCYQCISCAGLKTDIITKLSNVRILIKKPINSVGGTRTSTASEDVDTRARTPRRPSVILIDRRRSSPVSPSLPPSVRRARRRVSTERRAKAKSDASQRRRVCW